MDVIFLSFSVMSSHDCAVCSVVLNPKILKIENERIFAISLNSVMIRV